MAGVRSILLATHSDPVDARVKFDGQPFERLVYLMRCAAVAAAVEIRGDHRQLSMVERVHLVVEDWRSIALRQLLIVFF